jgi:hypothetical protein
VCSSKGLLDQHSPDKYHDAIARQIVICLEEVRPKMQTTLSVEEPLDDETLAHLLDDARLA